MSGLEQRPGFVAARVGGALLLATGAFLVLRLFLVPMAWAAIVAYVSWPLFRRARDRSRRPRLAAMLFTLAIPIGLAIPVTSFFVTLAEQGSELIAAAQEWVQAGVPLPSWLAERPWIGPRLESLRAQLLTGPEDLADYFARYGKRVSGRLFDLAGGVARNIFAFAIMLVTLYTFYVEGERLMAHVRRLAPIVFPSAPPRFLDHVGAVVRAVVFGLLGTALVQGALAAIGLAIFGVPAPVALGATTALLSFVPVGPPVVWGGAALWLFVAGHTGAAIGMAAWGLLLVSSVDNVLRPLLISSGETRIPFLLVFFGVIGGLAAFGVLGLFLGPVLLSVVFALLAEFPAADRSGAKAAPADA